MYRRLCILCLVLLCASHARAGAALATEQTNAGTSTTSPPVVDNADSVLTRFTPGMSRQAVKALGPSGDEWDGSVLTHMEWADADWMVQVHFTHDAADTITLHAENAPRLLTAVLGALRRQALVPLSVRRDETNHLLFRLVSRDGKSLAECNTLMLGELDTFARQSSGEMAVMLVPQTTFDSFVAADRNHATDLSAAVSEEPFVGLQLDRQNNSLVLTLSTVSRFYKN